MRFGPVASASSRFAPPPRTVSGRNASSASSGCPIFPPKRGAYSPAPTEDGRHRSVQQYRVNGLGIVRQRRALPGQRDPGAGKDAGEGNHDSATWISQCVEDALSAEEMAVVLRRIRHPPRSPSSTKLPDSHRSSSKSKDFMVSPQRARPDRGVAGAMPEAIIGDQVAQKAFANKSIPWRLWLTSMAARRGWSRWKTCSRRSFRPRRLEQV